MQVNKFNSLEYIIKNIKTTKILNFIKNLRVNKVINVEGRISSLDIFRSIAIIAVVLFHFEHLLPFGYLGVDLFFVISGLLIGGLLINDFESQKPIQYLKFIISRGFKIWPSYYFWILVGNIVCYFLYKSQHPELYIPFLDLKRYVLFYQNYTGPPYHIPFDGVWSLCVEEHFYLILPFLFIILQKLNFSIKIKNNTLILSILFTIIVGIVLKNASWYLTNSKDTFCGTHNRIDNLAMGVLLAVIIKHHKVKLEKSRYLYIIFFLGLILFCFLLYCRINYKNILYEKIYFHTLISLSFFCMIIGVYYKDFRKLKLFRYIAYYSYNLYLWHGIFKHFIYDAFGKGVLGFCVYIIIAFFLAFLTTTFIEEVVLKYRKVVLDYLFKTSKHNTI